MADWKDRFLAKGEDTTPDISNDELWEYDASANLIKRLKIVNLLGAALVALRTVFVAASSSAPASLKLHEDTDNGVHYVEISPPAALAANRAWTFDDEAGVFASKAHVAAQVVGLLDDKGNQDCSANPNYPAALKGDVYTVSVAGKIGGASGIDVEVGDVFRAIADNAGGTQVAVGSSWVVTQANLVGAATSASTNTFTNKTFDTAGSGNSLLINGVAVTANTGTGSVVRATAPTIAGPVLTSPLMSLTPAHTVDDTYAGTIIPGLNNSGGVTQWDTVYLNGSSQWVIADANGSGTYPARGLAISTETNGNPVSVLVNGTVRNDAWAWTPGGTIYLSGTAGGLTQTQPATSGDKVQAVGYALTADIAFFDFNSFFFTVT